MECKEVHSAETLKEFIEEGRKTLETCDYVVIISNERYIHLRKEEGNFKVILSELGEYEFKSVSFKSPNRLRFGNLSVYCDNLNNIAVVKNFRVKSSTNRIVYDNQANSFGPKIRLSKTSSCVYTLDTAPDRTL